MVEDMRTVNADVNSQKCRGKRAFSVYLAEASLPSGKPSSTAGLRPPAAYQRSLPRRILFVVSGQYEIGRAPPSVCGRQPSIKSTTMRMSRFFQGRGALGVETPPRASRAYSIEPVAAAKVGISLRR
jgi:hypothetical protein